MKKENKQTKRAHKKIKEKNNYSLNFSTYKKNPQLDSRKLTDVTWIFHKSKIKKIYRFKLKLKKSNKLYKLKNSQFNKYFFKQKLSSKNKIFFKNKFFLKLQKNFTETSSFFFKNKKPMLKKNNINLKIIARWEKKKKNCINFKKKIICFQTYYVMTWIWNFFESKFFFNFFNSELNTTKSFFFFNYNANFVIKKIKFILKKEISFFFLNTPRLLKNFFQHQNQQNTFVKNHNNRYAMLFIKQIKFLSSRKLFLKNNFNDLKRKTFQFFNFFKKILKLKLFKNWKYKTIKFYLLQNYLFLKLNWKKSFKNQQISFTKKNLRFKKFLELFLINNNDRRKKKRIYAWDERSNFSMSKIFHSKSPNIIIENFKFLINFFKDNTNTKNFTYSSFSTSLTSFSGLPNFISYNYFSNFQNLTNSYKIFFNYILNKTTAIALKKDKKNKLKKNMHKLAYDCGIAQNVFNKQKFLPLNYFFKNKLFKNESSYLLLFKEFTNINNFLIILSNPFIFKFFFLYLKTNQPEHRHTRKFDRFIEQISNFLFLKKKKNINNIFFDKHFIFYIKKSAIKAFSFFKLPSVIFLWHYLSLIKFLEFISGKKIFLKTYTLLTLDLNEHEKTRCFIWSYRLQSFQRMFGAKLFLLESLKILYSALKQKDLYFLSNWMLGFFYKLSFWKYKMLFRYLYFVLRHFFEPHFPEINVRGVKFQLKGKVSVAGNSRTRVVRSRIGAVGNSTFNNKLLRELNLLRTFTGVIGFKTWLAF